MKFKKSVVVSSGLAILLLLSSIFSDPSKTEAQIRPGQNSIDLTSPASGVVSAGQVVPVTCEYTTAEGFAVTSLVWSGRTQNNSPVVGTTIVPDRTVNTRNITVPSGATGWIVFKCEAFYSNTNTGVNMNIASERVINISGVTIQPPPPPPPPTNDTTAPSRPTNLTSSNRTSYKIQVNWSPSTDNVAVAGYHIYRNNGGSTSVDNTTPIATVGANSTSYTSIGLQSSRGYRFRVRAFDAAGNISNWGLVGTSTSSTTLTASTTAVTAPAASSVSITDATSSSLKLNWSPSATGEIFDYKVYANNGGTTAVDTNNPIATISTNPTSPSYCFEAGKFCFVHSGLNPSTTYKYRIAAFDPANNRSALTSIKSGVTLAGSSTSAPAAPSAISAVSTSQTAVNVTWSDNSSNETGFTLERATNTAFTENLVTLSPLANSTSQSVSGLASGATYYFRIRANNAVGSSAWSNVATVAMPVAPTAPSAPTNLTGSASNPTTVSLTWSDNSNNETGFTLQRSTATSFASPAETSFSSNVTSSGNITGLVSGTTYYFRIRANNAVGSSAWSNTFNVTMPSAPSAPTGVSVSAGNPATSSLTVSWSAVTGATSYKVYRIASNGQVDGAIPSVDVNSPNLQALVTGLTPGTTYRFLVSAVNSVGSSTLTPSGTNNASGTTSSPQITISSVELVRSNGTSIQNLSTSTANSVNIGTQNGGVGSSISIKANLASGVTGTPSVRFQISGSSQNLTDNSSPFTLFGDNGATNITPWSNLAPGAYTVTITPYESANAGGQVGVPVSVVLNIVNNDDSTPPASPTNVKMTYRSSAQMPVSNPTHPQTRVTWTASSTPTDVANYKVYRNDTLIQTVAPATTSFVDTTVNGTSSYQYKVTAIDTTGNESALPATGTTNQNLSSLFTINSQVIVPPSSSASVKSSPEATSTAGNQSAGATGSITYGPVYAENTLGSGQYWYVNFNSGTDGWVNQSSLVTFVPDTTAPTVTITSPTQNQVLASGTTSTNLTVTTNEVATCKWSTTNQSYSAMINTMSGSGSTSHTASMTSLNNGTSYTRYVACSDSSSNASVAQAITFSVDNPADTTAPTVTITAPTQNQVLPTGTTSTNLTVTTNEVATCKWSTNNVSYANMVDVFTGTNTTSHTYGLLGLTNGTSYTRYVACADAAGNASAQQARTFSVQSAPVTDTAAPVFPNNNPNIVITGTAPNLTLNWTAATDATAPVRYKVFRSSNSSGPFFQTAPAFTGTQYVDSNAFTSGQTYYELYACDSATPENCTNAFPTTPPIVNNPPVITSFSPAASAPAYPSSTTQVEISVTTNEASTCRWSTTDQAYASMSNTMSASGNSHTSTVSGLASGNSYTRYVRCVDTAGVAMTSSQAITFSVATFVPDTTAPAGNLGVVVGSPTPSSLTVSWNALTDASTPINYRLYRSTTQNGTYTQVGGNITGTSYVDTGRTASTSYWYKVDACDSATPTANCTAQSTAVSGTTSVEGTEPPISTTCPTMQALPASSISTPSVQLCAEVSNNPNRITLKWANVSGRTQSSATISRKTSPTATSWTQVGTVSGNATSWIDTNVTSGQYYEYQVRVNSNAYGYISAGINVPLEPFKGKMVLVIDNTFQTSLATQINTLIEDLTADRWVVIPKYVSRTDTPTAVRNQIKTEYDADPTNVKAVYLLGNIPVPRAGNFNGDGHGNRAVSTDLYYGEMTQEFNKVSSGCSPYTEVANIPSGPTDWSLWPLNYSTWQSPFQVSSFMPIPPTTHKFCLSGGQTPSALELQVGRVDMSNLTIYSQSEQTLLSNYLTKAREFKRATWAPIKRAFVRDAWISSGWTGGSYILGTYPSVFGLNNIVFDHGIDSLQALNIAPQSNPNLSKTYLFTSLRYGGSSTAVDFTGGNAYGNSYTHASSSFEMGGVFNQYVGSYLPEFNDYNSLLRSVIADGKALVSVHADDRAWYWHSMGLGQNIGHASRMSANNNSSSYLPVGGVWDSSYGGNGWMTLLGDPSLRAEYITPVSSLTLSNSSGKTAMTWPAAASATHGYNVYKITSSTITKLNGSPISGTSFTSTDNFTSGNKYMVTAVKLETTNGGTYYNESLGTIATVGGASADATAPTTPSGLVGGAVTSNSASFSWTASTDAVGVAGYKVFRSTSSAGTYSEIESA